MTGQAAAVATGARRSPGRSASPTVHFVHFYRLRAKTAGRRHCQRRGSMVFWTISEGSLSRDSSSYVRTMKYQVAGGKPLTVNVQRWTSVHGVVSPVAVQLSSSIGMRSDCMS